MTIDQKIGWILRLEQERSLRDPVDSVAAGEFPSTVAPDLMVLARDPDAAVRRRAFVALGRVGLLDGMPALIAGLTDADAQARGAAAFALGLMGDKGAVAPLQQALNDADLFVKTRAVEALGLIGDASAAAAVAHVASGCAPVLAAVAADDEGSSLAPDVDLCRVALFALVRLQQFNALATVALDAQGQPVSRWWPVAYALQRSGDRRAADALLQLAADSGRYSTGFALRGLAALKDARVTPFAVRLARQREVDLNVRVAAVRALGQIGGVDAVATLRDVLADTAAPLNLTLEAISALGAIADPATFPLLLDRFLHPSASVRAAAFAAAARIDVDNFLLVLSGIGRDPDWSVRAVLATILGTLDPVLVTSAVQDLADDEDPRVHAPALETLVVLKAPDATKRVLASLEASDVVERATAARLVGELRPPDGVTALVAAYARAQHGDTFAVRRAVLDALALYGGDRAIETLRQALSDRDWPIRRQASRLLLAAGQSNADPVRPASLRLSADAFSAPSLLRPAYSPQAFIETSRGTIQVELNVIDATMTTQSFIDLARTGFFNNVRVHRVVPGFVIQHGDPRGDGEGGPGYVVPDELNALPYLRGTMGMALSGPDTGGSQWFITLSPQPHLDGRYTVFGRVVGGWDVLDQVTQWDVVERVRIWDGLTFQ